MLVFSLTFTILLSFLTFVFIGNTYGTYSNVKGITINDIGIGGGWMNIDEKNITYNAGWIVFNSSAMGGYEYAGAYGTGIYGQNYTRMIAHTPGLLGLPHWNDMYVDLYDYQYRYLNATDIIANFDYSKNYTKTRWRAYQDHDDTGWDIYVFYRDYDLDRNNITQALLVDGVVNVVIAKQWSIKQQGFWDFAFWFGNMINPFNIGYNISSLTIIAIFFYLLMAINAICLIILAKYLVSGYL
jgi:hypothetical protein